jgi:ABC-type Fe3+-hydroxamate transport system substrate-binding protein
LMKTQMARLVVLLCVLAAGCHRPAAPRAASPRIITFAPHATRIALDLGLADHIVGVTSHCKGIEGMAVAVLGDGFRINAEAAAAVKPDILFHNTDDTDFRRTLAGVKIVRIENGSLAKLREGIGRMGLLTGHAEQSAALLGRIEAELDAVRQVVAGRSRPRVLFVMGADKPTTVGAGWTLSELIEIAGGTNAAAEKGLRSWGTINLETVESIGPDVLICQVDPGAGNVEAAREYWRRWSDIKAVRDGRLIVTDDASLTIEDSRVGLIARKLAAMIHPEAFVGAGAATAASAAAEVSP